MKFLFLILLTLSAVSCASNRTDREPSSAENDAESRGVSTDYYGYSLR